MPATMKIRPVAIPGDLSAVAAIINQTDTEPATPDDLAKWWGKTAPDAVRHRLVVEVDGAVKAYGGVARDPWDEAGRWSANVLVDRAVQGQGIGLGLYEMLEAFAARQGALVLGADVRENDPASLSWAQRRGFVVERHLFESTLDLATFDASRFAGEVERVEASGIRFLTLADVADTEDWGRRIHGLMCSTVMDIPFVHLTEMLPFDQWRKDALDDPAVFRDCWIMAVDGDRVVGATGLYFQQVTGSMYTFHTSVDREYRGRGLALALKLLSVRQAVKHGAPYMRTNNDSTNAPMLAVNRKLGYQPAPGMYALEKRL